MFVDQEDWLANHLLNKKYRGPHAKKEDSSIKEEDQIKFIKAEMAAVAHYGIRSKYTFLGTRDGVIQLAEVQP